jgi:hypothetical protein
MPETTKTAEEKAGARPSLAVDKMLSAENKKTYDFVLKRIQNLQAARQDHYGKNLENIWADADKDYEPHRLKTTGKKVIADDEDRGWRGAVVQLGAEDWQSDVYQPNPFIKIQTALSILIDRNPSGVFSAGSKRFQATTPLMEQLYSRNWEIAHSKQQLKLFVFNMAKYGWAVARTYPLKITNKVKELVDFDDDDPEKSVYQDKEVVEYNDIFRENLDPWNVWIDDMARPNNGMTVRDWSWRKVYAYDAAELEFGKYKNWQYVKPNEGGVTTDRVKGPSGPNKRYQEENLVEVYFYENRVKDLFTVFINNVPVIIEPLPIADAQGNKKLSLWQSYWLLRHAESPYGIGIYESIRYDQMILDRIRNMTVDQLTLSIYKSFFYQGTNALSDTGQINISPGVGRQVLDPKNINWLQVPGPGQDAWTGIQMFKSDLDEASGITPTLMGDVTGKTAFEVSQAKESALKRLKNPLDNICEALEADAYITISLIQLIYSIPETYVIADPQLIEAYLKEVEGDSKLYGRTEDGLFEARVYREFPLNLEQDEKGNLTETKDTRFFRIKPDYLKWEGVIVVKPQSLLTPSKQLDKALELEMYNLLIPLLMQPPELYEKVAKNIVKLYDKDPQEILPDAWMNPGQQEEQPLVVPVNQAVQGQVQAQQEQEAAQQEMMTKGNSRAQAFAASPTIPGQPASLTKRLLSKMVNPLRK